ncbi:hypothetical protein [Butyrivibrio sp. FCS014]|uniref:hypothetical protein n=1 Tax=Butyrivibrio sp. FCS014 TaxID=1408304 RepID=UPI000463EF26|nr:hypothetical protein [Butyrivibrio sp. FCS014]
MKAIVKKAAETGGFLLALKPAIQALIEKWDVGNKADPEILAGQVLYGLSATIHSEAFLKMNPKDREKCVFDFIGRVLD